MSHLRFLVTLAALSSLATPAWALSYDESVDGELSTDENNPDYLGELSAGTHTLSGHIDVFKDVFSWTLAPGAQIDSIVITYENFSGTDTRVRYFTHPWADVTTMTFAGNGDHVIDPALHRDSGERGLSIHPNGATVTDWTATIVVSGPEVVHDEAVDGELSTDENNPDYIGELGNGQYALSGHIDVFKDVFSWTLEPGAEIRSIVITYANFSGTDTRVRYFDHPWANVSSMTFAGDGEHVIDPALHTTGVERGLSIHPNGATVTDWTTVITVDGPSADGSVLVPGGRSTFTVTGVEPGTAYAVIGGLREGSGAVPPCPGLQHGLDAPRYLGMHTADAGGTVTFDKNVPSALTSVYLQLIDVSACALGTAPLLID